MSTMEKVLYTELRPSEFIERLNKCPIAYLPLGTLEWHGMHLPLGSDGFQSSGFFQRLARRLGGVVLPGLFVGPDISMDCKGGEYHGMDILSFEDGDPQQLAGSAYWIDSNLFGALLETVLSNLKRAGFKIVVAHGHGPSTDFFRKHADEYKAKFGLELFILWRDEEDLYGIQTDHAAFNETSLMLALHPGLVDMGAISNDDFPAGVWGEDPRIRASDQMGEMIIEKNLRFIQDKLEGALSGIKTDKKTIEYRNLKNLTTEVCEGGIK